MADGNFLQGLSEGIFGRLGELRQEKEAQDQQQKGQIINLLAGLADKVEPQSLPLLMGHIGDLTGINKNKKFKNFWQAFSGLPSDDMGQQLGGKLRDITQGMIGPQKAQQARQAYKQELIQPFREQGTRPRSVEALPYQTPPSLEGQMIFRDPRQEKLQEIESRYGAQLQNQLLMQEERHTDAIKRLQEGAALKGERDKKEYERKTNLGIDRLAETYMGSPDILALPEAERPAAARLRAQNLLSGEAEGKAKEYTSRQELRTKIGNKMDAEARAGGSPSQKMAEKRYESGQADRRRKMEDEIAGAQATVDALTPQIQEIEKKLDNFGKGMNPPKTRQELLTSEIATFLPGISKDIKEYRDKLKTKTDAEATLKNKQRQLEEFGKGQKKTVEGPNRARRTGAIRVSKEQGEGRSFMPGDIRKVGGKEYVVDRLEGGWWVLNPR